jgi:uncharacterized protein
MKWIVASDLHIPDRKFKIPEWFYKTKELKPDLYAFLGDITNLDVLEEFKPYIYVKGNMDPFDGIKVIVYEIGWDRVLLMHGDWIKPREDFSQIANYAKLLHCNIVLTGHTHKKIIHKIDNILHINPGSLTEDGTAFLIDFKKRKILDILDNKEIEF